MSEGEAPTHEGEIDTGEMKRCPDCAELVQPDARICRFCRFDFRTGVSGDGASRDCGQAGEVPRAFAMEMAWSQFEGGRTKFALDQAFTALQDAHDPATLSDLAEFAAAVKGRERGGRHRMRAEVLAQRVEQTLGAMGLLDPTLPPPSKATPRRPPPRVTGLVQQMGPTLPGGSAKSIMQPDGSLKCPRCGGTQFETGRSTGMKIGWGAASLLGSPNEVHCIACGAKYKRR
jgi:hypothetical protein